MANDTIEAAMKHVRAKMKDWKESNMNLIKGALAMMLEVSGNLEKVGKRPVAVICPFLGDKLGDVKYQPTSSEILMNLAERVGPAFIAKNLVKHGAAAKAPKVI